MFNLDMDEINKYGTQIFIMRWIGSAIFTVAKISMNLLMLRLLKNQFDDFYAEYGCFLKTVVTVQALSLLI